MEPGDFLTDEPVERPRYRVPAVFEPLWAPARYKAAFGGRGSGKSWNFAAMAVVASTRPGVRGAYNASNAEMSVPPVLKIIETLV